MKSEHANLPFDTDEIGSPRDYSESLYRFYFEIRDVEGTAEKILREFLGDLHEKHQQKLTHGFELNLPIQCVPDLVRLLTQHNVAIYQIVRYARVGGSWR